LFEEAAAVTQPFATAHVDAELNFGDLDAQLEARVTQAAQKASRIAQRELNKIKFTPQVDATALRAQLRAIDNLKVNVGLNVTKAEVRRFITELQRTIDAGRRPVVHIIPAIDEMVLRERLSRLPEGRINVGLNVTTAEINRFATDVRARLAAAGLVGDVRLDIGNEAAFLARLRELTRDRSIDVDVNGGGGGGLGSLGRNLDSAGRGGNRLRTARIPALVAAIGSAAGLALGAVGALTAGLAALGPAAAAGAATAAVGLSGIFDTFKAFSSQSASAASDGQAQAKAIEAATRGVESAEKNVARAKKDSLDAEKDLTRARKDAQDQIEDLNIALRGASLSEKDARLSIKEAARDLANLGKDGKPVDIIDRERAQLRLADAEQRLLEVQARNKDLAAETKDANTKGVEGSDQVTEAKDRLAEANDSVNESVRDLADAEKELQEAQTKTSGSTDKAAEALAKLSPNAQAFVLAMRALGPQWTELRKSVQDNMFAGLDTSFTDLANTTFPTLQAGMGDVATAMNGGAKAFSDFFQTAEAQDGLRAAFAGTATLIDGLQPGLAGLTGGFLNIAKAAEPAMANVAAGMSDVLSGIGDAFTDAFENGSLTTLISTFGDILSGLGGGLNSILDGLIVFGNTVGPTIGPLFESLGQLIAGVAPALGALGAAFSNGLQAIMPTLTVFIAALAEGLTPVLPILAELIASVGNALVPLIGPLSEVLQVVGTALVGAIEALAPAIAPLGEAFASLVTALAPILPVIAEVIAQLVEALAPALTVIFQAFAPVIQQLADALMPVIAALAPVLADVAMTLAEGLADAITALAPLLPQIVQSFTGLLFAIIPILPQLAQMTADLLPSVVALMLELAPIILDLIDAFTWLVNNVLVPLVIPTLQMFADQFKGSIDATTEAVGWAKDFIGDAVSSIGGFFSGLGDTVARIWDGIVRTIKSAVGKVGDLLLKIPEKVGPVPIPGGAAARTLGSNLVAWSKMRAGGRVRGPGGPTDDVIPTLLSNGEFVNRASSVTPTTLPFLEAINAGWVPDPAFLQAMVYGTVQRRAGGGLVSASQVNDFPRSGGLEGAPYEWGGVNWGDCSGAVSAVVNYAVGEDPFGSRGATGNFDSWLAGKGLVPGLGPAGSLNVGWFNGGPYGGHTAATLPDGTNIEMGGGRGDGQVGGAAAGADDSQFTDHAHLPPEFFAGGDELPGAGDPSFGSGTDSYAGGGGYVGGGGSSTAYDPSAVSTATTGYSLPDTGPSISGGGGMTDPYSIGTGSWAERIDAGNRWAADQNFGTQAEKWGYDAAGSIAADLLAPIGLGGLAKDQISNSYEAMLAQRQMSTAGTGYGDGKLADTIVFENHDERKATEEMERMLNSRTTPATVSTRNGG
jgi:phage-related protein